VLIVLSLIWGSSFILMKKALVALEPMQMAIIRICIAAGGFLPFALRYRRDIDWSKWKYFAVVGFTGSGIPAFLYAYAQTEIVSSVAGILNSLTPIFTFVIGVLFFSSRFNWLKLVGVILGFLGAASLILLDGNLELGKNAFYAMLIVIGTICYGISVNTINRHLKDVRSIIVASVSFVMIGVPAVLFLIFGLDFSETMAHPSFKMSMISVVVLAFFGTFLASVYFFELVKQTDAVFASSVAYIMPIIALGWGFVDGEMLGILHLVAMVVIIIGVYLIRRGK
jgi:drug/metabolite transporter (DMT)-like permease